MVDSVNLRTIYNQIPNGSLAVAKLLFKSTMDYTTVNHLMVSDEGNGLPMNKRYE